MPYKNCEDWHSLDRKRKQKLRKKPSRCQSDEEIAAALELLQSRNAENARHYHEQRHSSDEFVVASDPKSDDDDDDDINNNNKNHIDMINEAVASMPIRNVTNQRVASKQTH